MITIKAVTLTNGEVFVPVITGKDLTTGQNIISWVKVSSALMDEVINEQE